MPRWRCVCAGAGEASLKYRTSSDSAADLTVQMMRQDQASWILQAA